MIEKLEINQRAKKNETYVSTKSFRRGRIQTVKVKNDGLNRKITGLRLTVTVDWVLDEA